jgi:hypothetical protein
MEIKLNKAFGVVSTSLTVTNREMDELCEMKERVIRVLNTHNDEKVKNEYLSDTELKMLHAILHALTKEYDFSRVSTFQDTYDELYSKKDAPETPQQEEDDE